MTATTGTTGQRPEDRLRSGGREAILAAARQVGTELAERAERYDREGRYAAENIDALWAAGLGNLNLPVELGGLGADLATTADVVEAVATGDPSTALIYVMHLAHLRTVAAPGSPWPEHLRDRVVADSLAGPALINALRVEPELGTPARGGVPATVAVRGSDAEGRPVWRISGRKIYSTGSQGLKWMMVWGATAADDPEGPRIGSFLVPGGAEGVEIVETWDHLGMRASASHDVVFHDVEIPLDHAVNLNPVGGPDPASAGAAGAALWGWTTVLLLRIYTGVAKAGRDWLAGYLNERKPSNLGASLATLPRFQAAVGEIEALIFTADSLVADLTAKLDGGGPEALDASRRAALVKVVVTGNVIKALEAGLGLIGNPGLSYHHPLQRHYRNALCSRIHTPQDDVVLTAAGKAILAR
jgi:alkylation response protein AidB-like acyl-CoA dehydrogenase